MFYPIVLTKRKTTTIIGRNVEIFTTGELLVSSCFSRKVGVSLHLKTWQLGFCFFFFLGGGGGGVGVGVGGGLIVKFKFTKIVKKIRVL